MDQPGSLHHLHHEGGPWGRLHRDDSLCMNGAVHLTDIARPAGASPDLPSGGLDLLTMGETMVLLAPPEPGLLRHARQLAVSIGGAESNVAIGAQRLGLRTAWIGRIGDDELGQLVLRELRAEGIDVRARVDPGAPTALMFKEHRSLDVTRVWYYRKGSAGSRLAPEDLDLDLLRKARILHVTGITPGLSDSARDAVEAAVTEARRAGAVVSVDLNYRRALWDPEAFGQAMRALVARAHVVFASPHEAGPVVGPGDPEHQATALAELGPSQAILKLGADGALAVVDGKAYRCAALPVTVVDRVGAGDAFVAGWLAGMTRTDDVPSRLARAVACGSLACAVAGDWEGYASLAELEALDHLEDGVVR